MRLVLVHGRSQQDRSAEEIKKEWTAALKKGWGAAGIPAPQNIDVRVPFYGVVLDEHSKKKEEAVERVIKRGPQTDSDEREVTPIMRDLLTAIKDEAGITDAEVLAELDAEAVEMGPGNWEWVQAIGRAISKRLPWVSDSALARFLADVDVYLNRAHVTHEVNELVSAEIDRDGPNVVVGHSLGSVVTYRTLTDLGDSVAVPLYVTLGSPLAIDAVKKALPTPRALPSGVRAWLNGADERDPVALHSRLDRSNFCEGIENVSDIKNPHDNPHGIAGYLGDVTVARKVAAAIG